MPVMGGCGPQGVLDLGVVMSGSAAGEDSPLGLCSVLSACWVRTPLLSLESGSLTPRDPTEEK